MKNLMIKTWKPLLSLLFGVAVVIFWAVPSIAGTTGAGIPIGLSLHPAAVTASITRLYLACIDDKGNVSKPFLLPQRNPKKYYDELLDSYNTPDFTSKPVELDARAAGNEIMSDKRIPTKVR